MQSVENKTRIKKQKHSNDQIEEPNEEQEYLKNPLKNFTPIGTNGSADVNVSIGQQQINCLGNQLG